MVGIRMIQKTRKRKYQLIPELSTTSRLTVPGLHSHPSTPKLRQKRCVQTSGDPWDTSQPPGSSLPVYGTTPTANRWYLHLAPPSGNNDCRSVSGARLQGRRLACHLSSSLCSRTAAPTEHKRLTKDAKRSAPD